MEARWHDALRLVPWESWQLWDEVREAIFSSMPDRVSAAVNKIGAWRARSCLPVAVEVTWDLISIQMADPYFSKHSGLQSSVTKEMLCLMYAMAIMRLINGVVDHSKRQSSLSVADRAEAAGLPRMLVDIRHEVAHQELPSLPYLQLASKEALEWLKVHYWEAQRQILDNALKYYQDKLHAYASKPDPSECGHRKKFLTVCSKKLVKLSGPVANFYDECNSNGIDLGGMTNKEAEEDKDLLFSDDSVDAVLQESERALSRATKRLQPFCRSHHRAQHNGSDTDVQESVDDVNTVISNVTNPQMSEIGNLKIQSYSKAVWVVADNWRPCSIGMLPSKIHPAGVLPFSRNNFLGVTSKVTACHVNAIHKKPSRETHASVPVTEDIEVLPSLEMEKQALNCNHSVDIMDRSDSELKDPVPKRLKTDTEAHGAFDSQDNLRPLDTYVKSDVPNKNDKVVRDASLNVEKRKPSLSAGGLLLLNGVYQRCRVDQLAAIRSSIQVLK